MPITFYFVPNSTANFTSAVLAELDHGQSTPLAKRVTLSIKAGDTKAPEYLANVNPNGLVPAIVHDGVAIWESAAITMYLGEMFGEKQGLYPALGTARGEAMKWIVWSSVTVAQQGSRLANSLFIGAAGGVEEGSQDAEKMDHNEQAKKEAAAKAKDDIEKSMRILNDALEGRDFLLKEGYCLADTHLWSLVGWLKILGTSLDALPNVMGWEKRVGERPALGEDI